MRAARGISLAREPVGIAMSVPALVVPPDHLQPVAVQEVDVDEQLLAEHRVRPHQLLLGDVERAALLQHVIRDADLADVVEQEAVLDARIVEQRRLDRLRQLDRVALDPLRVRRGAEILRLERARERSHRLAVRPLQELPAAALDLEQATQVVRVQQQLLVGLRRHAGAERALVEPAGEVLDDVQQLERAERLAEEHVGTRLSGGLLGYLVGAGEQDDPDPARRGVCLQPPAERDAVFAGQPDVEHDDVGCACGDRRRRLRRGPGFVDLDVDQLERRPQERQQPRIVVDEEDARRAGVDPWKRGPTPALRLSSRHEAGSSCRTEVGRGEARGGEDADHLPGDRRAGHPWSGSPTRPRHGRARRPPPQQRTTASRRAQQPPGSRRRARGRRRAGLGRVSSGGGPEGSALQHLSSRVAVTRKSVETAETCTFVANPSFEGVQELRVLGTIPAERLRQRLASPRNRGRRLAAITSAGRAAGLEPLELAADSLAAAALYERHSGRVFGYCLSRLGRREDAEDAVQTTFLHAVRGLRRGVVPATEIAWLLGIARNVCLTRWESVGRRSRLESPCDPVELDRGRAAPQGRREELIGLEDALSQLPEQQRRAVLLRDWRGLSYDEVAAQLGVSRAAVETLIFRGRRTLAELLREEPQTTRRRLRSLGDLGSLLSAVKAVLTGGAAATKIAATAVTVAALSGAGAVVGTSVQGGGTAPADAPATKPAPAGLVASVAPAPSTRGAKPDAVSRRSREKTPRHALPRRPSPPLRPLRSRRQPRTLRSRRRSGR